MMFLRFYRQSVTIFLAISHFLHQWLLLFLPYHNYEYNLAYFRSLLDFFTELTLYRNETAKRKVYIVYVIIAMFAIQNLYLWAFLPPALDRLRQGDVVSLVLQVDAFNLITAILAIMLLYIIHVLAFTMKPSLLGQLEDTLFVDRHRTLTGVAYGRLSEQETARIIIFALANQLHSFMLVIDAAILFLVYSLFRAAIENPGELLGSPLGTPLSFIWNVSQAILGTWITVTTLALYSKVGSNAGALGIGQVCILFRRLVHSETLLAVYRRKDRIFFSLVPFRQYLMYSGQTFGMLFTTNELNGKIFLAFLLVNMPISAWALVQITLGNLSTWSSMALSFWAAHELNGCILLHWTLAKFTKRLHAPSKTLLRLNASTGHRVGNFRARLLLHHTIVRLHTKSQYGLTYGSVGGLITMDSFGKCLLFYMELLMYAYTLVRGI